LHPPPLPFRLAEAQRRGVRACMLCGACINACMHGAAFYPCLHRRRRLAGCLSVTGIPRERASPDRTLSAGLKTSCLHKHTNRLPQHARTINSIWTRQDRPRQDRTPCMSMPAMMRPGKKRPSGAVCRLMVGLTLAQEQAGYGSTDAAPLWVFPNSSDTIRSSLVVSSPTP
jgi:ferredoxin